MSGGDERGAGRDDTEAEMADETEPATTGTQPVLGGVTALLDVMGEDDGGDQVTRRARADGEPAERPAPAPGIPGTATVRMPATDEPVVAPAPPLVQPAAAAGAPAPDDGPSGPDGADGADVPAADGDKAASLPFPVMHGRERGYRRDAVESFLARARASFESGDGSIDARTVREVGFPLVRGGYQIAAVDAALGRIEDAFAARERREAVGSEGPEPWVEKARSEAQVILDRLSRPERRRFDRVSALSFGYAPREVDIVADRISAYLQRGEPLTAEQVRSAAFRMTRRGYREEQVDALLDAAVEVILAVR